MNKKIYCNNKCIEFTSEKIQSSQDQADSKTLDFSRESLKKVIEEMLNDINAPLGYISKKYLFSGTHFSEAFNFLKEEFHYIVAAGGFIRKKDEFLFIYRHNRWDLPKGKLDKGESIEHAAIRECEEECDVHGLKITDQLSSTFHIYPYKKSFALKQTYWYYMTTEYDKKLVPQLEEDITDVQWFPREVAIQKIKENSYFTIADVTHEALALKP